MAMTDREHAQSGTDGPTPAERAPGALEERRASMQSAEGHAGSVPRGNQQQEKENVGHRWEEYERVLGH
jgi:hypothetical protein